MKQLESKTPAASGRTPATLVRRAARTRIRGNPAENEDSMGARSSARAHSCRASNFDERNRDKITNVWHNGARRPDAVRLSLRVNLLGSHLRRRVDFLLRQIFAGLQPEQPEKVDAAPYTGDPELKAVETEIKVGWI